MNLLRWQANKIYWMDWPTGMRPKKNIEDISRVVEAVGAVVAEAAAQAPVTAMAIDVITTGETLTLQ